MKALKSLAVVALLGMVACKTVDPFVVSGNVLNTAGEKFIEVADAMEAAHNAGQLSDERFKQWEDFAAKFKAAFPAAVHLWNIGMVTNDDLMANQATKLISDLAGPLAQFAADVQEFVKESKK